MHICMSRQQKNWCTHWGEEVPVSVTPFWCVNLCNAVNWDLLCTFSCKEITLQRHYNLFRTCMQRKSRCAFIYNNSWIHPHKWSPFSHWCVELIRYFISFCLALCIMNFARFNLPGLHLVGVAWNYKPPPLPPSERSTHLTVRTNTLAFSFGRVGWKKQYIYNIVACQVHPALVKWSRVTRFYVLSVSSRM